MMESQKIRSRSSKGMTLRSRSLLLPITFWLVLICMLVAIAGGELLRDISGIHARMVTIEKVNQRSHALHDLEMRFRDMAAHAHDFLISGATGEIQGYHDESRRIQHMLEHSTLPRQDVSEAAKALERMDAIADRIFSLPFATGNMEGPILVEEMDGVLRRLVNAMSAHHHRMDEEVRQAMHAATALHLDMRGDLAIALVTLLVLLIMLGLYLYRRVIHPLIVLRSRVSRIGAGDFSPDCPDFGENEIGALARALNRMGDALKERDRELAEAKSLAAHHEKMQALGLMAANIAHEIGNPLSAAKISLDVCRARLDKGNSDDIRRYLNDAWDELHRTEKVIGHILDFTRRTPSAKETVDVDSVIESAIALARMARRGKKPEFVVSRHPDLPPVSGNEDMIRQVMVNLLINAMDASGADGCIRIMVSADTPCIHIDVIDSGAGVPDDIRERIFSPLFTTKGERRGAGLGLSISRDLMRRMQGELILKSSSAKGSCFRMTLPIADKSAEGANDARIDR